jgi:hypothetical protein
VTHAFKAFAAYVNAYPWQWTPAMVDEWLGEDRFGSHPIQVVHEWNTAAHVQDGESDPKKRAFTKAELHTFFAHCDNEVPH